MADKKNINANDTNLNKSTLTHNFILPYLFTIISASAVLVVHQ